MSLGLIGRAKMQLKLTPPGGTCTTAMVFAAVSSWLPVSPRTVNHTASGICDIQWQTYNQGLQNTLVSRATPLEHEPM